MTVFNENSASSFLMQSILSKVSDEFGESVDFQSLDIDEASLLINSRNMYSLPLCFFISNGDIVEIFHGLVPEYKLVQNILKYK